MVQRIVGETIQSRLHDPRIEPLTSVTRVEVSADLSVAHVYISVLAPETRRKLTLRALEHAAGRLRARLAEQTVMRQTPVLVFHLDDSLRKGSETLQIIEKNMEELREREAQALQAAATAADSSHGTAHPAVEAGDRAAPDHPQDAVAPQDGSQEPGGRDGAAPRLAARGQAVAAGLRRDRRTPER